MCWVNAMRPSNSLIGSHASSVRADNRTKRRYVPRCASDASIRYIWRTISSQSANRQVHGLPVEDTLRDAKWMSWLSNQSVTRASSIVILTCRRINGPLNRQHTTRSDVTGTATQKSKNSNWLFYISKNGAELILCELE